MANKDAVIAAIATLQGEIEQAVAQMPEQTWAEGGWNARQILCHIASMSGTAGFTLGIASLPSATSLGGGFDENAFNAQLVAARESKSNGELLAEIKSNFERDIDAVRAAPDYLLQKHFRAWDVEGELGDVIVESLNGHIRMHLADLRSASA